MSTARIGLVGVLALAPILFGCSDDELASSSAGTGPAACQQEAQKRGFIVLDTGAPEPQSDGSTGYSILVKWGNDGGVHLRCRTGAGGTTIS
jgi:hypothetical protein